MAPPPVAPEASTDTAVSVTAFVPDTVADPPRPSELLTASFARRSATLWPLIAIAPPFARPEASSRPVPATFPPAPPVRMIEPPLERAEATESSPGTLTASRIAFATVAALSCTDPPAARTLPETSISAWPSAVLALVGTATCKKLSPVRFSVACSPEPIATFPSGTDTTPELATVPPMRPTKPPAAASIEPALTTPAEAPAPTKLRLPLLKSLSAIPKVEATKPPPTRTAPVLVIAIPFGLTR